jgi:hypothetical protein
MEKFEIDTRDIVNSFIEGRISFIDCVHGLDAALSRIIPNLTPEQLPRLQAAMLDNNERVLAVLRIESQKLVA